MKMNSTFPPLFSEDKAIPWTGATRKHEPKKNRGRNDNPTLNNLIRLWGIQRSQPLHREDRLKDYLLETLAEMISPAQWEKAITEAEKRIELFFPQKKAKFSRPIG